MLAVLGLMGFALGALLLGDSPAAQDDDDSLPEDQSDSPAVAMTSLSDMLEASDEVEDEIPPDDDDSTVLDDLSVIEAQIRSLGDQLATSDADTINFADDADNFIATGAGNDYLDGRDGDDILFGGAGNDVLHGGRGDDLLVGGDGDDEVYGHVGNDILFGGDGNDDLVGGDGDDILFGGAGNDSLMGSYGNNMLFGGSGADTILGGPGNDIVIDRDDLDRDYLNGGAGDDYLSGGPGDHLNGGPGVDIFNIRTGMSVTLHDFNPDEDVIEIEHEGERPTLTTGRADDGTLLLANGQVIAKLVNFAEPDLAAVTYLRV